MLFFIFATCHLILISSIGDIGDELPDTRSVGRGTHRTARERRNSYRRSRAINISLYSALSMAGYADEMNLLDHLLSLGHALDTCKDVQVKLILIGLHSLL